MIVYKDYVTFTVLGWDINLFSEQLDTGRNTIAEIDTQYHYLGDEPVNISTAIFAYQEVFEKELSSEELRQTMLDNILLSEAV